jgi:hypothetical protein
LIATVGLLLAGTVAALAIGLVVVSRERASTRAALVQARTERRRAQLNLLAALDADLTAVSVVDPVQRPVATPLVEVAPDGALGREVHGQLPPLAAGAEDREDGVEDVPHARRLMSGIWWKPAGTGAFLNGKLRESGRWGGPP